MSDQETACLVVLHIADQLADLERRISVANSPGCLDGLFAQQVLREISPRSFTWQVNPLTDRWLEQNADRLTDAPQLAALGYGLAHADAGGDIAEEARKRLAVGLTNLMRRDPYPSDRVTFLNDPRQLLGIANAAAAVRSELPQPAAWLAKVIEDPRFRGDDIRQDLMRRHLRCVLIDEAPRMADTPDAEDAVLLSLIYWMTTAGTVRVPDPATDLKIIQRGVLNGLMRVPASALSAPDAALLLAAATRVVEETIDSAVLNRSHVGTVLRRFPAAMRRWRYDPATLKDPVRWVINSEREVQDIVWILLRTVFPDVVDEEPLRKVGHSSYKSDFGIPSLGVLVEIKYARSASDFRRIEKEVFEDSVAYQKDRGTYKEIVIFIYDASASNQEHDITAAALLGIEHISDVIIVSRPSQLPAPNAAEKVAPKRRQTMQTPRRTPGTAPVRGDDDSEQAS